MRKLSKQTAERMCEALDHALDCVKSSKVQGLCVGLDSAHYYGMITENQLVYILDWIDKMLGEENSYLEHWYGKRRADSTTEQAYKLRKRWVKWMKNHLRETT